jgi:hypothetical protein
MEQQQRMISTFYGVRKETDLCNCICINMIQEVVKQCVYSALVVVIRL